MSTTAEATAQKETYRAELERLERESAGRDRPALRRLRAEGLARFEELSFPTLRNEDWRFTNLAPLARASFRLADGRHDGLSTQALRARALGLDAPCRLVFVNGHFAPELSAVPALPPGVLVGSLAEALEADPGRVEAHLGQHAPHQEHALTALNTAFLRDGACVLVPAGTELTEPVHLVFVSAAVSVRATVSHPRNLVVVGGNGRVCLVEHYLDAGGAPYWTNAVTEVVLEDGAGVEHYKVQEESLEAFHIATTQVRQARGSNFSSTFVGFGGALVRNEVRVLLDAERCEATLNGVYLAAGRQHMDNHTVIDHAKAHCASHELYKGILDGQARGVFNGKIFVREDAQKTDAKQTNQTLLLSEDATINTKPQLEIYADDVKCTHGATVGHLDEEATFYLRSRGIGRAQARGLLTFAFANDVISRIKVEPVRARLEQALLTAQHLPQVDPTEERS